MCILGLAIDSHPLFPFICIHNRDEVLSRPSVAPDSPTPENPIISGKDKETGGTWMGLNSQNGNFVCLTNFRNRHYPNPQAPTSRGLLLQEFLEMPKRTYPPPTSNCQLFQGSKNFAGFNMIHTNLYESSSQTTFLSNRIHSFFSKCPIDKPEQLQANHLLYQNLEPGVYAISNSVLNDPTWPKVIWLKKSIQALLNEIPKELSSPQDEERIVEQVVEKLANLLLYTQPFAESELPNPDFSIFSPEMENAVQRTLFLEHESGKSIPPVTNFGTRCQTLCLKTKFGTCFYFWRSTDDYPKLGPWKKFSVKVESNKQMMETSLFDFFSDEILFYIFDFLHTRDLQSLNYVSKRLYEAVNDPYLWSQRCKRYGYNIDASWKTLSASDSQVNWKRLFFDSEKNDPFSSVNFSAGEELELFYRQTFLFRYTVNVFFTIRNEKHRSIDAQVNVTFDDAGMYSVPTCTLQSNLSKKQLAIWRHAIFSLKTFLDPTIEQVTVAHDLSGNISVRFFKKMKNRLEPEKDYLKKHLVYAQNRPEIEAIFESVSGKVLTSQIAFDISELEAHPKGDKYQPKYRRNLRGHSSKVYSVCWSGDSKTLISASQDARLIVWDALMENKTSVVSLKTQWVMCTGISPSGALAASGGLDNICSIWKLNEDIVTESSSLLQGHVAYISSCRFLDDNKILTSSGDSTCALWDISANKAISVFRGHSADIMTLSLNPSDPNSFSTGGCDGLGKIWDIRSAACTQSLVGHDSDINAISFSPSGLTVATGSDDCASLVWDLRSDRQMARLVSPKLPSSLTALAFSASSRYLFAAQDNGIFQMWDVLKSQHLYDLAPQQGTRISCLALSPDGQALCSASWDSSIKIWG